MATNIPLNKAYTVFFSKLLTFCISVNNESISLKFYRTFMTTQ